jgi:hypothetical protein
MAARKLVCGFVGCADSRRLCHVLAVALKSVLCLCLGALVGSCSSETEPSWEDPRLRVSEPKFWQNGPPDYSNTHHGGPSRPDLDTRMRALTLLRHVLWFRAQNVLEFDGAIKEYLKILCVDNPKLLAYLQTRPVDTWFPIVPTGSRFPLVFPLCGEIYLDQKQLKGAALMEWDAMNAKSGASK